MITGPRDPGRLRRFLLVSAGYIAAFLLLTLYNYAYFSLATGIMVVYLPAGLNLALLLRYGPRYAVAIFVAGLLGGLYILAPDAPSASLVVVALTTPLVEAVGAWLLRRWTGGEWHRWRLREMALFVLVALTMPAFVAVLGIANYVSFGQIAGSDWGAGFSWESFFSLVLGWWVGDVVGILALTPVLMLHVFPWIESLPQRWKGRKWWLPGCLHTMRWRQCLLIAGQSASIAAMLWLSFMSPIARTYDAIYLSFLPLFWIVTTHGLTGAVLGILAIDTGASYVLAQYGTIGQLANLQLFMVILALVGLFLGDLISERRLAEEAVRVSEGKLKSVMAAIPDLVFLFSRQGEFISFSQARIGELYADPQAFLGRNVEEVMPPLVAKQTLNGIEQAAETGQVQRIEYSLSVAGQQRDYEAHLAMTSENEAVCTVRDVTERRRARHELERLIGELGSKNAEMERFIYTVSHDLKSPLITIRGFLGLIEQDALRGDEELVKSDMARVISATDKMQRMLGELLELSRIGRIANTEQEVPFDEIVRDALESVRGRLKEGGVDIRMAPSMPLVCGDRPRLVEVMQNLIDNAAKYMGSQVHPTIEIGVQWRDSEPIFFVRDNGMGIEPQYQERVFGLFERLDPAGEGTGVGLAIVKRIIETTGGRIWVESEGKGKGSSFLFTLPGKTAEVMPGDGAERRQGAGGATPGDYGT
jgi:two-component system, LuxR family, sensor kinase FixL